MEAALLVFAVTMACLAVGVTVICVVAEAIEAHEITHQGWVHGHRSRR
ncbi:MAG: hypothetical protein ACTHMS_00890 [Jatrophihabitans sp.]